MTTSDWLLFIALIGNSHRIRINPRSCDDVHRVLTRLIERAHDKLDEYRDELDACDPDSERYTQLDELIEKFENVVDEIETNRQMYEDHLIDEYDLRPDGTLYDDDDDDFLDPDEFDTDDMDPDEYEYDDMDPDEFDADDDMNYD